MAAVLRGQRPSLYSRSSFLRKRALQVRHLNLAYSLHEPQNHASNPENAPIIIMHGLFGSKQNNRSISRALARDLNTVVYAVDLRNHGDSPHHKVHDYESMATDVEDFIVQHNLNCPILIGHSMGAKVAMTVALRTPKLVRALIPVDNAPADAVLKSDFARYVQGMKRIVEAGVTKQAEADDILKPYENQLAIRQFILTNLVRDQDSRTLKFRIPVQILAGALDNMGDFPFKDPDLARYDGRTLVIRGSKSHYVPDEMIPLIGRFFPLFEIRDIDSGHWVISEQPEAFRQAVVEYLRAKD